LPAGSHPIVVTYFDNGGGDGLKVSWSGPGFKKQPIPAAKLAVAGADSLHDVAIRSLKSIPGHEVQKFRALTRLIKRGRNYATAIHAIRNIPQDHWPKNLAPALVQNLVAYLSEMPAEYRTGAAAMEAMKLTRELTGMLPKERVADIENRLANLNVRVIAVGTVPHRMKFDKERIVVQAGKTVEFRFSNTDNMPHNFAIVLPGSLEEVGLLAEATANEPDAMARHYIPKSDKILTASQLLQTGETQALSFEVPSKPGVYPFVCTYPGHWTRMYGALYVVADVAEYRAAPEAYVKANSLTFQDKLLEYLGRETEWKFEDLVDDVKPLAHGRSFEVGKEVFKVASCVSCHKMNGEGIDFGPDLAKVDPKLPTEHFLESLLLPSKKVDEKYQTYTFQLASGKVVTGMIVEETPAVVKVIEDPLKKAKPIVIRIDDIEARKKSPNSIMPNGLANKLTREEILDLLAYIHSRGDKKHKLSQGHHDH
jgi:putative heme-binding domain-containing protein